MKRQSAPKHRDPRSGTALIIVIVFMAIFGTLGIGYWRQLHFSIAEARVSAKESAALALADAGIARAIAELRAGNTAFAGVAAAPLGKGHYTVSVTHDANGSVVVESVGTLGEADDPLHQQRRRVRIVGAKLDYLEERR